MKAVYYYAPGDIRTEEAKKPQVGANEMLLKVRATAICGTDLRIYKYGHFKIPEGEKRVLGHELAGEIAEVGANVKGYKVGMRVAVPPNVGCGNCPMCLKGFNQLCPDYDAFGISMDGGFQEYMLIPASAIERGNVIEIPDSLSYEEAALTEPFSCTYNAYKALKTEPGDTVLVIGAGPIGACHVMINKLAGACKIIVADISQKRLDEMDKFGADVKINSAQKDLKQEIMKETAGFGVDVVITANSVPELQALALELAAPRGRINFFGGMPKGKEMVSLNTNLIHYKELIALATTGSSLEDFYTSLQIASSGKIPLREIATGIFTLDEAKQAFEYASSGAGMKALIVNKN